MGHIVIDTTSGKNAGQEALEAAAAASLELDVELTLVGDQAKSTDALCALSHDAERLRVVHADGPLDAVRVGLERVSDLPDAVFISAGPPAAIVRGALDQLGRIEGVHRAALAAVYPTLRHRGETNDPFALLLDVGATVTCKSEDLVGFAAMGASYARLVSVNERPRVALLCNGSDTSAAPPSIRAAHKQLQSLKMDFSYIGLIRGDHVTFGEADVVVTEGFTGDIVVRTLEGVVATASALIERASDRFRWRMGMSMLGEGINRLKELTDWQNYGGAPLLGLTRPVIVAQSDSGKRAFINAIRLALKIERTGLVDAVADSVRRLKRAEEAGSA